MLRLAYLVVDDDPLMLAMLEPKLRASPLPDAEGVRSFQRPEQALAWLDQAPEGPAVVVSDFNLKASINGLELLARVAIAHPSAVRILMSGYSREQIGVGKDAPIHGFVEKELRADDILRNIRDVIQRARSPGAGAPSTSPPRAPATHTAPPPPAAAPPTSPLHPSVHTRDLFLRFIQSTSDYAVISLDPNGIVTSWNPGAERIKGWNAKEIIGRHFSAFYPAADVAAQKPRYVLQRAAEEGRFEDDGWRARKDGSMFWANAVATCIRDESGNILGFIKVTRDMTARRHAEEAVRQSEERYRLFIASVKDYAMFILDPTGHVMTWNEGAQRLKGYAPEEIVGKHFSVFYAQADRDRQHPQEELSLALREGRYEEEGWRVRKDGSRFWANVTITALFDGDRRHVGFSKVTRDLTERKRAEESLRQRADSFAELNRELDAFSHTVAHDLRAPANHVHSLSADILETASKKLDDEDRRALEAIRTSARQMRDLINDLLEFSLTARQEPIRTEVDLAGLARQLVEEKKIIYPAHRIHAQIEPGLRAHADPRLLQIALGNLIDNAVKFSRDHEATIEIGRGPAHHGSPYYVRDHGVGIPHDQVGRLFQPFTRLHGASEYHGTGIGLTIVDRIVRRHGGTIWLDTQGPGTTFCFTLSPTPDAPPDGDVVRVASTRR